jgi:hypothetical protein
MTKTELIKILSELEGDPVIKINDGEMAHDISAFVLEGDCEDPEDYTSIFID